MMLPEEGVMNGVVWAALSPEALAQIVEHVGGLVYEKTFHPHVTLEYGVTRENYEVWRPGALGRRTTVLVTAVAWDFQIQAAAVSLKGTGLISCNPFPHITLSAMDGVEAYKSNVALEYPEVWRHLDESLPVEVVVEWTPLLPKS